MKISISGVERYKYGISRVEGQLITCREKNVPGNLKNRNLKKTYLKKTWPALIGEFWITADREKSRRNEWQETLML